MNARVHDDAGAGLDEMFVLGRGGGSSKATPRNGKIRFELSCSL